MRYRKEIKELLGEEVLPFLNKTIRKGKIRRDILKNLASELELFEAYINKISLMVLLPMICSAKSWIRSV